MIGSHLAARYHLLAELGRGGRGVVYRAHDPMLKRDVAVKIVSPTVSDAAGEQRFLREAQLVAQMDAPGIVPIFDFGRHEGVLFYVMPVLHGTTLRELYKAGTLSLGEMLEIGAQIAEALDYSHSRGVIHRDVKPENVMVSRHEGEPWRVRLMDFGLAQEQREHRLTRTGELPGTLSYLSPEQVIGTELDGRSDLYAVGAVLYEGLAGEPPFAGQLYSVLFRIVHEAAPALPAAKSPSAALETLVLAALSKEPAQRPQRGRDMASALRSVAAELGDEQLERRMTIVAGSEPRSTSQPLIGRAALVEEVALRLERARGGEAQFLLIGGEGGVGKSRFLQAVERAGRDRQYVVLRGRFAAPGEGLPFHGLCELIQDYFRVRRLASPTSTTTGKGSGVDVELAEQWVDVAAPLLRQFPSLTDIAELQLAAEKAGELPPMARATELFELLARAFTRMAGGRPLLLSLENLHLDPPSTEGLQYVVRRLGATSTLVAATYRSEEIDRHHALGRLLRDFADDPRCLAIRLAPFDVDELRRFLTFLVDGAPLRPELVARLHGITEGNARFARELVSSWLVSGDLRRDDSGLLGLGVGEALPALPATVQEAVEGRIAHLPPERRALLELAAVLGRTFDERLLAALIRDGGEEIDLDDALDDLVEQGILQEETRGRGDRLRFSHGVVRDVLYHDLPRRRRRRLHRRVAELIESRYADKLAPHHPRLLHHYAAAEAGPQAITYALALAQHALAGFSPHDALDALGQGLNLVDEATEPVLHSALLELAAQAHRAAGDVARALQRAEQAWQIASHAGERAAAGRCAWLAADAAWQGRRVEIAARWVERCLGAVRAQTSDVAPAPGSPLSAALQQALALGAMVAGVRGDRAAAAAYRAELEKAQASAQSPAVELQEGGELVVAMANPIRSLDPGLIETDEEGEIAALVYETLVANDGDGPLMPGLAASWDELEDGRLFAVMLRPEARFADGRPVDALAVKASLERTARRSKGKLAPGFFRVIDGMDAFLAGDAGEVAGIEVRGSHGLNFRLVDSLPIFPVLLSDVRTAIVRAEPDGEGGEALIGSGPFQLAAGAGEATRLERVDSHWRGRTARVERLEFRTGMPPGAIALGLKGGGLDRAAAIDIGRDLLPSDLDELLANPAFRAGLAEATRRNTCFALFNAHGPLARHRELRRALCAGVQRQDLVWRTLGRFAQPAIGLIPPGMLGHDAGRRPLRLDLEEARSRIRALDLGPAPTLRAVAHQVFLGKYRPLLDAVIAAWAHLGVAVEIVNRSMPEFLAAYQNNEGIDVQFGRWNTDYDDPDNFTYNLLHSQAGIFQRYFASEAGDRLLEKARQTREASQRAELYRRFEALLVDEAAVLPLCHDVDYRLAAPGVGGLHLRSVYPYVNYTEIGRRRGAPAAGAGLAGHEPLAARPATSELSIPCSWTLRDLDPLANNFIGRIDVEACVFETLLRMDDGGRPVPHLARSIQLSDDARVLRLRLRSGITFHDGRRLTARDVRYTFERMARTTDPTVHNLVQPIVGARSFRTGECEQLAGFQVLAADEIQIELEEPLYTFPAILTHPSTAIVPEGSEIFDKRWREGTVGTGPFRVVQILPELLELERYPGYWRPGLPRTERLIFHLGLRPERIDELFRQGKVALANDLRPAEIEALLRDRPFPFRFHQHPRLSTHFLLLNSGSGLFADKGMRRRLAQAIDIERVVAEEGGRLALPARGLIPPALLGLEPRPLGPGERSGVRDTMVEPRVALHATFYREFAGLWAHVAADLARAGFACRTEEIGDDYGPRWAASPPDIVGFRWIADFPDADAFLHVIALFRELGMIAPGPAEEVARLGRHARRGGDSRTRRANYLEIEALIEQECLLIPLLHEQAYRFYAPDLHGLRLHLGLPEIRYEELWRGE